MRAAGRFGWLAREITDFEPWQDWFQLGSVRGGPPSPLGSDFGTFGRRAAARFLCDCVARN